VNLQDMILETLDAMLTRPRMYAQTKESLEDMFFILFVTVAPSAWGVSVEDARNSFHTYTTRRTQRNQPLSTIHVDIDALAKDIKSYYDGFRSSHQ
jgi:hypothetical protein